MTRHVIPSLLIMAVVLTGCINDQSTSPVPGKTWVAIEPIQCLGNPWEQDWLEKHDGDYGSYPKDPTQPGLEPEEFEIIKDYYAHLGVVVFEAETARKYDQVCLACSCPEGHTLYLLVRGKDVETMVSLGYRVESPE